MAQDYDDEIDEDPIDLESPLDADEEIEGLYPAEDPVDEADWLEQHQPVEDDDEDYVRDTE